MPLIVRVPELGEDVWHAFTGCCVAPDDEIFGGVQRGEFYVLPECFLHPLKVLLQLLVLTEWDIGRT